MQSEVNNKAVLSLFAASRTLSRPFHCQICCHKSKPTMAEYSTKPFLPLDLILNVIDFIVPSISNLPTTSSTPVPIVFPQNHPVTKTLLSLTRTSRALYTISRRLLYTHCLNIDTLARLTHVEASLSWRAHGTLPAIDWQTYNITSLYLAPCEGELIFEDPSTSMQIASAIRSICGLLGPTLRHLVMDLPLRSLRYGLPEPITHDVARVLRSGLLKLVNLETFCSVGDEGDESCAGPDRTVDMVWSLWPKLESLALYNIAIFDERFWDGLKRLENLKEVALTRADALDQIDLKLKWKEHCGERKVIFAVVNAQTDWRRFPMVGKETWKDDEIVVKEVEVPVGDHELDDAPEICQEWVKAKMLGGIKISDWD